MKTIILPGFSVNNKNWTNELKENLKSYYQVEVINWEHWKLGGGLKLKKEMEKISKIVGNNKFNIIAKSVGTMVALKVLEIYKDKINKIILCGIPSISSKRMGMFKNSIKDFNSKKILCFQNSEDPFVPFKDLKKVLNKIDKNIVIVEKIAKNHDYYYSEDFQKFLFD